MLATLAARLAHDFNNLLFAVIGNATLAPTTLECGSASSCERVNPRMKVVQPCATGRLSDLADSAHRRAAVQQHDSVRARCGYWLRVVPSREAGSLLIRFQTTRATAHPWSRSHPPHTF